MFTEKFDNHIREEDSVTCEKDGITYTATVQHDWETSPHDYAGPGCYFDPDDTGYGDRNKDIIHRWEEDEWHYFGVILSAHVGEIEIDSHVSSLWGIEGNFPGGSNDYFTDVANELLAEAHEGVLKKVREMAETLVETVGGRVDFP